jgi:cobalt/nickel transport system permease protein
LEVSVFLASAQLHIPDGFLSLLIAALAWLLAAIAVAAAARRAQADLDERLVPLAGVMAAFIFAGQMINFPVAGGTSGHLVGAALAAIVLGPWLGILVMTAVIALQALLFQDGGLVAMGANILVMGVLPAFIGYGLYRLVASRGRRARLAGTAVAAWLSVMAAALLTALLLGFSNTVSFAVVVPVMLGIHALIGLGEALITAGALSFILAARPQLLEQSAATGGRGWVAGGIVLALLVVLIAPLASGFPDGLEWVGGDTGFLGNSQEAPYELLPDYTVPLLGETALSTIVAGLSGALLVAAIALLAVRALRRRAADRGNA